MARLTWQDVAAPNVDIRGLAIAGQTITNGFDRFAQMLYDRETAMQKRATDDAVAGVLAGQDPNAGPLDVSALGARVNKRAVLEADNAHRSDLIQRADQNEDLLTKQATAKFGTEYGPLAEAYLAGNQGAIDEVTARSKADPLWGRFMSTHVDRLMGFKDQGIDNRLDADKFGEDKRSNLAGESTARGHLAVAQRGQAMREREVNEDRQRRLAAEQAQLQGRQFAEGTDLKYSPEDALTRFHNSDVYKGALPHVQAGLDAGFKGRYTDRTTTTDEDLSRGGSTGGMPSFLLPNGGAEPMPSYNSLAQLRTVAQGELDTTKAATTNRFLSENRVLDVYQRSTSKGVADATSPDAVKYYEGLDFPHAEQTLRTLASRYNLSPAELIAIGQTHSVDGGAWYAGGRNESKKLLEQYASEYAAARDDGAPVRLQTDLSQKLGVLAPFEAALTKADARLKRESAGGRTPSAEAESQYQQALRKVRELRGP